MFFDCPDPPPLIPDPPPLVASTTQDVGPKRVHLNGIWYDRFPNGRLEYCKECNNGKVPYTGAKVSQEEHNALIEAGAKLITVPEVTERSFPRIRNMLSGYDSDHQCNQCGSFQYVVSGSNGRGHTHTCSRCHNTWWH